MPSQFETEFTADLDALYDEFGRAGNYSAPDGSNVADDIAVIVQRHDARQIQNGSDRLGELQTADVRVRQTDVPKVVKDGRFTVENQEVWTVETTPVVKNGQHYCTCSRSSMHRRAERPARP